MGVIVTKWTPEEDRFLCAHYAQDGVKYCADRLGRTDLQQLRNHAHYLGLSLPRGQLIDKDWCRHHLDEIRCLSPWTRRLTFGTEPEAFMPHPCLHDKIHGIADRICEDIDYKTELSHVLNSIHTHNLRGVRIA